MFKLATWNTTIVTSQFSRTEDAPEVSLPLCLRGHQVHHSKKAGKKKAKVKAKKQKKQKQPTLASFGFFKPKPSRRELS